MEDWDDDFADGDAVVVPQAPLRLAVDPASMENWDTILKINLRRQRE